MIRNHHGHAILIVILLSFGCDKTDVSSCGRVQGVLENQSLTKNRSSNKITYSASIRNGGYNMMGVYVFAFITNKLPANTQVDFDVSLSSN